MISTCNNEPVEISLNLRSPPKTLLNIAKWLFRHQEQRFCFLYLKEHVYTKNCWVYRLYSKYVRGHTRGFWKVLSSAKDTFRKNWVRFWHEHFNTSYVYTNKLFEDKYLTSYKMEGCLTHCYVPNFNISISFRSIETWQFPI